MGCLLDALSRAYDVLDFGRAAGGDEVLRDLVLARIIEPFAGLRHAIKPSAGDAHTR